MNTGLSASMQRRLFWRSLCMQACWSFERMQSFGFVYCIEPWLQRCYGAQPEALREAQQRHSEFFNTQPHMASLVIGMTCALEESAAGSSGEEKADKVARLRALKAAAAAALAGLGDALFWGALRPFCAALALAGAMAFARRSIWLAAIWSAAAYLAAYDLPALALRWGFLRLGYEWKDQIAVRLRDWPGQKTIRYLRWGGSLLALGACGLMLWAVPGPLRGLAALGVAATVGLKVLQVSAYKLYVSAALIGTIAAWAGWL
ncbi:MAG: PTS system mannose/fructose/sorbose family transporter subunit IID [Elusimicrobiota bacterium]|jgi:mannose/fructose/N-acetylgalactosamine-specific phosphotransferase system component IID